MASSSTPKAEHHDWEPPLYGPAHRLRPFSNGTEYHMWLAANCMRGERGCRSYNPDAPSSRTGCPIECALARANWTDGTISMKHALRGGFVEPGPRGLYRDATVAPMSDGIPGRVIGECPEYRGYDEPDDRPRRGPKPPAGQMDLLDPSRPRGPSTATPRDRSRNRLLLDMRPDLVIAFPGGRGTADMVREARRRGVPVREVR